ncbi:MAG: gliding motility-associated C-terminal domain-containing protein [Flavobacteriales bacterium]|mgnify:FL=1
MKSTLSILVFLFSITGYCQEICNNGIDDDFDGLIDLQDTSDCSCVASLAGNSVASLVPNPSFEQRSCCPTGASQLNCANNWIQASGATSDYFNTCGLTAIGTFPPPPLPLPNGTGYVGFFDNFGSLNLPYKEFIGTCLLDTLKSGVNYQLEFFISNSFGNLTTEIALYGTTSCGNLPFGNPLPTSSSYCPATVSPTNWSVIKIDTVTCSSSSWIKVSLNFTATQNFTAIILGGSCNNNLGSNYYYIDDLILNKTSDFSTAIEIKDSGHYCQGNLVLKAQYNSSPKSFQWYKDSIAILGATDSIYSVPNGQIGNYQLLATFDSICALTNSFKVDTTIIEFDLSSRGSCPLGIQSGFINIFNVDSISQPYSYSLNSGPFVSDTFFDQLSAGNYTITVRDSNFCETSKVIMVDSFPMPTASFIVDSVCLGETTTFTDNSSIAKGTITQWSWDITGLSSTQNTSYTYGINGVFPVTHQVVSDSGCVDDTIINAVVHPLPIADFSFSPTEVYAFNPEVCFSNLSIGSVSYFWDFDFTGANGTSNTVSPCLVRFPSNQKKNFMVNLSAISDKGCLDSTSINVSILNEFILYIPNSFTPNGDDKNDEFVIISEGIETFKIFIFNSWGEIVFSGTDPLDFWDGKYKNEPAPTGTYIYKINVKGENREVKEVTGHVNLMR